MDKYIGFDIDDKKTVACMVQKGKKDIYDTIKTDPAVMKQWLARQRKGRAKLHLTFEVSGAAGWLYDELVESVDTLTVSNPSKMTWIYRTAKEGQDLAIKPSHRIQEFQELATILRSEYGLDIPQFEVPRP